MPPPLPLRTQTSSAGECPPPTLQVYGKRIQIFAQHLYRPNPEPKTQNPESYPDSRQSSSDFFLRFRVYRVHGVLGFRVSRFVLAFCLFLELCLVLLALLDVVVAS